MAVTRAGVLRRDGRILRVLLAMSVLLVTATVLPASSHAATRMCFGRPATIVGTNASETIYGTAADDVIVARGGNDTIRRGVSGWGGFDSVCAGRGRDRVFMDGLLYGGRGPDRLIAGSTEFDALGGGPGDDHLDGGRGPDSFGDYAFYRIAKHGVKVDLAEGIATGEGTDTLVRIDGVEGSPHDDILIGKPIYATDAQGGAGDDTIRGDFRNIVRGEEGRDTIRIAFFAELVDGGEGSDWIRLPDAGELVGGPGDDTVVGTRQENFLSLEDDPGNDTLHGRQGNDDLSVRGGGRDSVFGGRGIDTCEGDSGDAVTACEF